MRLKAIGKKAVSALLALILITTALLTAMPAAKAASAMTTGENGINLIKSFEGFSPYKYWDNTQWTIGYGSYCGVNDYPNGITEAQAVLLLESQLSQYEGYVNTFLNKYGLTVNQNQFDALVSFTYNLGNVWITTDTFTLRNYLIDGIEKYSDDQIDYAFGLWCKSGGQVVEGLVRRRAAEAALFCTPCYYVVYYNAAGGSGAPAAEVYTTDQTFRLSTGIPTRAGYQFLGWTTDPSNTTRADYQPNDAFATSSDVTLYAVWQRSSYTIIYNANEGTGEPAATTKQDGVDTALSTAIPKRTGYSFLGWSEDPYAEEPSYTAGGSCTLNHDTVLYAVWERYITVGLDTDGGTFSNLDGIMLGDLNGDQTVDVSDFTVLDSIVNGFTQTDSSLSKLADLNMDNAVNSLDLIILEDYLNQQLSTLPALCVAKGSTLGTLPEPVKDGLYFAGWRGEGDFTLRSIDIDGSAEDGDSQSAYNMLYAVWSDTPLVGDVDMNGSRTVADVVELRELIMKGSGNMSDAVFAVCDVNADDIVTVSDVVALRSLIMSQ